MAAIPPSGEPRVLDGPANVPVTFTESSLTAAPAVGLAMLKLTAASVRCKLTVATLPAGSVAESTNVLGPGLSTTGKRNVAPPPWMRPDPASTTVAAGSSVVPWMRTSAAGGTLPSAGGKGRDFGGDGIPHEVD